MRCTPVAIRPSEGIGEDPLIPAPHGELVEPRRDERKVGRSSPPPRERGGSGWGRGTSTLTCPASPRLVRGAHLRMPRLDRKAGDGSHGQAVGRRQIETDHPATPRSSRQSFPSPEIGRGFRGEGCKLSGASDGSSGWNVCALIPSPSPASGRRGRRAAPPTRKPPRAPGPGVSNSLPRMTGPGASWIDAGLTAILADGDRAPFKDAPAEGVGRSGVPLPARLANGLQPWRPASRGPEYHMTPTTIGRGVTPHGQHRSLPPQPLSQPSSDRPRARLPAACLQRRTHPVGPDRPAGVRGG